MQSTVARRGRASLLAGVLALGASPMAWAGPIRVSKPGSDDDGSGPTVFHIPIDTTSVTIQIDAELSNGVDGPAYVEIWSSQGGQNTIETRFEIADYDGRDAHSEIIELPVATCAVKESTTDDPWTDLPDDHPLHVDVGDQYYDCDVLPRGNGAHVVSLHPRRDGHVRKSFDVVVVQVDAHGKDIRLGRGLFILERRGPALVSYEDALANWEPPRSTSSSGGYATPRPTYPSRRDEPAALGNPDALRRAGIGLLIAGGAEMLAGGGLAIIASTYSSRGQEQVDDAWPDGVPAEQQQGVDDYLSDVDSSRRDGLAIGLSLVGVGGVLMIAGAAFAGRARKASRHARGRSWGGPGGSVATLRF